MCRRARRLCCHWAPCDCQLRAGCPFIPVLLTFLLTSLLTSLLASLLQVHQWRVLTAVSAHLDDCGVPYYADGATLLALHSTSRVGGAGFNPELSLTLTSWQAFREFHRRRLGTHGWRLSTEGVTIDPRANALRAMRVCDAYGVCVRIDTAGARG